MSHAGSSGGNAGPIAGFMGSALVCLVGITGGILVAMTNNGRAISPPPGKGASDGDPSSPPPQQQLSPYQQVEDMLTHGPIRTLSTARLPRDSVDEEFADTWARAIKDVIGKIFEIQDPESVSKAWEALRVQLASRVMAIVGFSTHNPRQQFIKTFFGHVCHRIRDMKGLKEDEAKRLVDELKNNTLKDPTKQAQDLGKRREDEMQQGGEGM